MTIEQTIDIPANREVTIRLVVPETVPCGKQAVILDFPAAPPPAEQKPEESLISTSYTPLEPTVGPPLRQSCRNMEELIAASDRRLAAEKADPSLRSLKPWHGILENSKAWGKHVDAAAEIRKMRDEWPDYWGTNDDT